MCLCDGDDWNYLQWLCFGLLTLQISMSEPLEANTIGPTRQFSGGRCASELGAAVSISSRRNSRFNETLATSFHVVDSEMTLNFIRLLMATSIVFE